MLAFACAALALLSSCVVAPTYYEPGIDRTATEQQAVLELGRKDGAIVVRYLDGKQLANPFTTLNGGYSAVLELRLVPGIHTVEGLAVANGLETVFRLQQDFGAGKHYRVVTRQAGYSVETSIEIVGTETPQ